MKIVNNLPANLREIYKPHNAGNFHCSLTMLHSCKVRTSYERSRCYFKVLTTIISPKNEIGISQTQQHRSPSVDLYNEGNGERLSVFCAKKVWLQVQNCAEPCVSLICSYWAERETSQAIKDGVLENTELNLLEKAWDSLFWGEPADGCCVDHSNRRTVSKCHDVLS